MSMIKNLFGYRRGSRDKSSTVSPESTKKNDTMAIRSSRSSRKSTNNNKQEEQPEEEMSPSGRSTRGRPRKGDAAAAGEEHDTTTTPESSSTRSSRGGGGGGRQQKKKKQKTTTESTPRERRQRGRPSRKGSAAKSEEDDAAQSDEEMGLPTSDEEPEEEAGAAEDAAPEEEPEEDMEVEEEGGEEEDEEEAPGEEEEGKEGAEEEEQEEEEEEEEEEEDDEDKSGEEKKGDSEAENPDTPRKSPSPEEDVEHDDSHPYVGKSVKITQGPDRGKIAKLLAVRSRGWWTLEGVEGNIHSRRCVLMDKVEEEEMIAYYEKNGRKYRGTPVLDKKHNMKSNGGEEELVEGGAAARTKRALDAGQESRKRKLHAPLVMSDLVEKAAPSAQTIFCDDEALLQDANQEAEPWVLPPIVLEPDDGVPAALRHLAPTHLLEVFDRKTGTILDARIAAEALPEVLRRHAEYEPIIPRRDDEETSVRRGRSSANLHVSETVRAQKREDFTRSIEVVVKSGPYKGKEGRIRSSLPGGWCLVDGILGSGMAIVMSPDVVESKQLRNAVPPARIDNHAQTNGNHAAPTPLQDIAPLRSTFKSAMTATVQAESKVTRIQLDALRKDKTSLQTQLAALGDSETPGRKRLQKRLDYLNSCLEKAEWDSKNESQSATVARVASVTAFRDVQRQEES